LGVAIGAGFGVAWLERVLRERSRLLARGAAFVALGLVTVEAWHGPIRTEPFTGIPPIYATLRRIKGPVVLVELPFPRMPVVYENGEYMVNSTAHWRPMMNGMSGFTPYSYRGRVKLFSRFPDPEALEALYAEGATHVMVNTEKFSPSRRDRVLDWMATQRRFRLIASGSGGRRLYEVTEMLTSARAPEIATNVPR